MGIEYYHHMLGAVLVHPDHREVIPLAPQWIVKGDGDTKNDGERNAAKREGLAPKMDQTSKKNFFLKSTT